MLADESGEVIDIPTCHIVGCDDPYIDGAMALYSMCDQDSAELFDHGSGHSCLTLTRRACQSQRNRSMTFHRILKMAQRILRLMNSSSVLRRVRPDLQSCFLIVVSLWTVSPYVWGVFFNALSPIFLSLLFLCSSLSLNNLHSNRQLLN